jgi:hypothetical protein
MEGCFSRFCEDAGELFSLYCQFRLARRSKVRGRSRRAFYRRIAKEKAVLVGLGYSSELVRLVCYGLADPRIEVRWVRARRYFERWHEEATALGVRCPCCRPNRYAEFLERFWARN